MDVQVGKDEKHRMAPSCVESCTRRFRRIPILVGIREVGAEIEVAGMNPCAEGTKPCVLAAQVLVKVAKSFAGFFFGEIEVVWADG